MVKTAILECPDTFEDSSVISSKVADLLSTKTTKVKDVVLRFDQTVRNVLKAGTEVDSESILCTIEDAVTADNELFDEDSLDTLKLLSGQTPKSKYTGVVERVELYYNGDKEDMSPTIRQLADASDKELAKLRKSMGKPVITRQVDSSMRVDGNPLELDYAVLKFYITADVAAGVGDKGVFGNQMKTIFGRVMSGENKTEDGEDVDAIFSYQSIANRIVLSPTIMGTTNTLLRVLSKRVAKLYFGK
jgi:hypothetical protein